MRAQTDHLVTATYTVADAKVAEDNIRELTARTGRKCGACSLCCKLLTVQPIDPEPFAKPGYEWCQHCKPGQGCSIHSQRPSVCRAFACQWLINSNFGDEWYPLRSKMVLHETTDATGKRLHVVVDNGSPTAWRREPFYSGIRRLMQSGLRGESGHFYYTVVHYGKAHSIMLFPNKECDANVHGVIVQTETNGWDLIECDSEQSATLLRAKMDAVAHIASTMSFSDRYKMYLELREGLSSEQT